MEHDNSASNESIGLLVHKHTYSNNQSQQQTQQNSPKSAVRKKKFEIPKEELKDEDFDQIVVQTSALITKNIRANQQSKPLESANRAHNQLLYIDQKPNIASLEQYTWNQTPGSLLISGNGSGAAGHSDVNQPKRPMNAFMVWGQAIRRELHNKFSNVQNAVLSKALGRVWKRLDLREKEPFIMRANIIKSNHKRDYPNYRYQPRRIQEKQRRTQQNDPNIKHNNHHQQQQQRNRSTTTNTVIRRPSRSNDFVASVPHISIEESTANQASHVFPIQDTNSAHLASKLDTYDDDHWRLQNVYNTCESDDRFPSRDSSNQDQDDKYFNYEHRHQSEHHVSSEYNLPPIDTSDNNNNNGDNPTNHMIGMPNQASIDDHHLQVRLFYDAPTEHLKQTDVPMVGQSATSNICMDQLQHHEHHNNNSLSIYDSNYRQQYQQQHEGEMQQQQDNLNDFSINRQSGNEQMQYYDCGDVHYQYNLVHNDGREHQHQHQHQNRHQHQQDHHHQQQHFHFRQINDLAHANNHETYRAHTQAGNHYAYRGHSDEICPV